VTYDGIVKVTDFGAARATPRSIDTRTGTMKEKVAYLSPEQALGVAIDRRSDIYALGVVLWEMITGQRFAKLGNDLATLEAIVQTPPRPPSQLRPECTPELERVVLKALAVDPQARFQTGELFELALEDVAREQKLRQSTISLRTHMQQLFAAEIVSWKELQTAQPTGELTAAIAVETDTAAGVLDVAGTLDTGEDSEDDADYDAETSHFEPEADDSDYTQVESIAGMSPPSESYMESVAASTGTLSVATPLIAGSIQMDLGPLAPQPEPHHTALVAPPHPMMPTMRPPVAQPELFPVAPHEWTAMARPVAAPMAYMKPIVIAAVFIALFVIAFIIALLV
jgi:serine/threonine protein kinase